MKRAKLTNREFDEAAKRLLSAAAPKSSEIERIVSDPQLFDGVMKRIAFDAGSSKEQRFHLWKPVFASLLLAVIAVVPAILYIRISDEKDIAGATSVIPPGANTVSPAPSRPDPPVVEIDLPDTDEEDNFPRARYAVLNRAVEVPQHAPRRSRPVRTVADQAPEPSFVPISLAERAEEAALDGRVVRVEVPRAALFAMGVNIPLENGVRPIKADLLLGPDGTPRAIRLVE
jgi:hypothetical protein